MNDTVTRSDTFSASIEAEIQVQKATSQILRIHWDKPVDKFMEPKNYYWLDLCLTPRPRGIRACYPEHWGACHSHHLGETFIVPPGERFYTFSEEIDSHRENSQTSLICQIHPSLMDECFNGELEWTRDRLEVSLDIPDRSIRGLLMRLTHETLHPGFAHELMVEAITCQVALELGRYITSENFTPPKGGLAAWRLRLIDERLHEMGTAPTLKELADLCNISVRQLSRGFRVSKGCSIGSYVEQTRLEAAKRLLIKGEPIKKIASLLGYASPSSFSFAFRRATGVTPAYFRNVS